MTRIEEALNLGPVSAGWLRSVGILTLADLEAVGAPEAYRRVREAFPGRASLNLLWALQGALLDVPWNALPEEMKMRLRREAERASKLR